MLISPPTLVNPDFDQMFTIQCDASDKGVGAVLTQQIDGKEGVVAYFSQKLTTTQQKYHTTEKECLAVLTSIEKFRPYIEGSKFKIITDHASLRWLKNLKDPTGRLGRWALKLQQYDFELIHRKGKFHIVPDALSRAVEEITVESADKWYSNLKQQILENPDKYGKFRITNNQIYKYCSSPNLHDSNFDWKLVVPEKDRNQILHNCHDHPLSAHMGVHKTLARIAQSYYWPKLAADVKEYVQNCEKCKGSKNHTTIKHTMLTPKSASEPWELIAVDYLGPLTRSKQGNMYILVIIDVFSKFVQLFPLKNTETKGLIKILIENIFNVYGTPKTLISDNGPQFTSNKFQELLKEHGILHFKNARYHPQNNPAERINSVVLAAIRSYLKDDQREWDKYISEIACALRTAKHESTQYTPFFIVFGKEMKHYKSRLLLENSNEDNSSGNYDIQVQSQKSKRIYEVVKQQLKKAFDKYSSNYNLRTRSDCYNSGDIVWKKNFALSNAGKGFNAKLAPKWIKCRVRKKIGYCTYELEDLDGKYLSTFNVKDIYR